MLLDLSFQEHRLIAIVLESVYIPRLAIERSMLSNNDHNLATLIQRRRASWLAVLPIALLQLTIAIHQFDHVAEYIDGACHVCVQLDRVDAAVDHPAEKVPQLSVDVLEVEAPPIRIARESVRNFESRAPPFLLSIS